MQELSIVSGPTGCGKTTFLSQISIDLLKKDIPVLWGSF
jgi:twinkle protein